MIGSVVFIVVGSYVGMCALFFLAQKRLIFHPFPEIEATPEALDMKFEDLMLRTEDGVNINAWYVPAEKADLTILFCHGNAGNLSNRLDSIKVFHELGFNVLIFDYRGYGRSEGAISERGLYADSMAAWSWLVDERGIQPGKIVLVGRSLGGAVASWLAGKMKPRALVLESAFASIPDMGADMYPIFPIRMLARFKLATKKYLPDVACPVMIMHSPTDEIVPFKHGKLNYERVASPKRFVELRGGHNDCYFESRTDYTQAYRDFLLCR